MRELEEKINSWRQRMAAAVRDEGAVRELESHLRDHIETLVRRGVPPAAAFAESVERLGPPQRIAREFALWASLLPASWPVRLVLATVAVYAAVLIGIIGANFLEGRITLLLATHVVAVTVGYISALAAGVVGAVAVTRWRQENDHRQREQRRWILRLASSNAVLTSIGMGLGMVWARDNLGGAWSWDPKETGALLILLSSILLLLACRRTRKSEAWLGPLALVGGFSVLFGWFGVRSLGAGEAIAVSAVFAAAQIVIVTLRPRTRAVAD